MTYDRNTGYGQSKLAAERILVIASQQSGVPISVVRVGQVGGSNRGDRLHWADQPWISALIRTSKTLGSLPSPVAPLDWVSVDDLATLLESIVLRPVSGSGSPQFFNVVSKTQSWEVLVGAIRELEPAAVSKIVPLSDWVHEPRQLSKENSSDITKLPALRLLDFYEGLGSGSESLNISTANSQAISGLDLGPLKHDLLVNWLKTWVL